MALFRDTHTHTQAGELGRTKAILAQESFPSEISTAEMKVREVGKGEERYSICNAKLQNEDNFKKMWQLRFMP